MDFKADFLKWLDDQSQKFNDLQAKSDQQANTVSQLNTQIASYITQENADAGIISQLKIDLQSALSQIDFLKNPPVKPKVGVNVHFFNSDIYKDVDRTISDALSAGFKFFRLDFFTQPDGSIQQEAFFLTQILPKCYTAGLIIQPMLNTPGLTGNTSDIQGQYNLGYKVGNGFANRYGKYFNQYEIGNELAVNALLPNTDGRALANYDQNKLTAIASYLKGMNDGIKAAQITATTILNGEWLHTAFIDFCRSYGVGFNELSWHWYTNQDGAMSTQGWNTGKILFEDWLSAKYPGIKIRFNEVGYYSAATAANGFSQSAQSSKLMPLVQRLASKGYEVTVYQLYDQDDRLPNPYESTYGIFDNAKQPKDVVSKIKAWLS